jgi:hypothetical protein
VKLLTRLISKFACNSSCKLVYDLAERMFQHYFIHILILIFIRNLHKMWGFCEMNLKLKKFKKTQKLIEKKIKLSTSTSTTQKIQLL